jgi:hypothetical protein
MLNIFKLFLEQLLLVQEEIELIGFGDQEEQDPLEKFKLGHRSLDSAINGQSIAANVEDPAALWLAKFAAALKNPAIRKTVSEILFTKNAKFGDIMAVGDFGGRTHVDPVGAKILTNIYLAYKNPKYSANVKNFTNKLVPFLMNELTKEEKIKLGRSLEKFKDKILQLAKPMVTDPGMDLNFDSVNSFLSMFYNTITECIKRNKPFVEESFLKEFTHQCYMKDIIRSILKEM